MFTGVSYYCNKQEASIRNSYLVDSLFVGTGRLFNTALHPHHLQDSLNSRASFTLTNNDNLFNTHYCKPTHRYVSAI